VGSAEPDWGMHRWGRPRGPQTETARRETRWALFPGV
jgi:hypothetical protein